MVRTVATSPANTGADLRVCVGELMAPPERISHFKRIPRSPAKPAPRLRRRSHVSWYFEYIGGIPGQVSLSFSALRFRQTADIVSSAVDRATYSDCILILLLQYMYSRASFRSFSSREGRGRS